MASGKIEIVVGTDAENPTSLAPLFAGVDAAMIVTPLDHARGMSRDAELSNNMINAAYDAGVKHGELERAKYAESLCCALRTFGVCVLSTSAVSVLFCLCTSCTLSLPPLLVCLAIVVHAPSRSLIARPPPPPVVYIGSWTVPFVEEIGPIARRFVGSEALLKERASSGKVTFTILRVGSLADNLAFMIGRGVKTTGTVNVPATYTVVPLHTRDIGRSAAAVLANYDSHEHGE
jgi:hypothetical protein